MSLRLARRAIARPMAAAGRSDNFNRADSATSLGTPSDGGAGYATIPAAGSGSFAFGISSNKAYLASGGIAGGYMNSYWTALLDTAKSDIDFSIDFSRPALTGSKSGMVCFAVDRANDNQGYVLLYGDGNLWLASARTNARNAVIASSASFSAISGTFRVTRIAATGLTTVYFNGVQQFQATDLTYSGGKSVGFGTTTTADGDRWDNLVAV